MARREKQSERRYPARSRVMLIGLMLLSGGGLLVDWYVARPLEELDQATYVGRASCAQCHEPQHRQWLGSHHDQAMEEATDQTVLGDFNDATFTRFDSQFRFFRRDGGFFVNAEGPDGQPRDYQIKYTFGVDPLQQYMVEFDDGRVQVLSVAWGVGRQQWFFPTGGHETLRR